MLLSCFLQGVLLGLGLILPLGPQNVFILSQGMAQQRLLNIVVAVLVASLADTTLILLAVGGVSVILLENIVLKYAMLTGGIVFLSHLAIKAWSKQPVVDLQGHAQVSVMKIIGSTLAISWLNPYALIDSFFTIGSASIVFNETEKLSFVLGCIGASWIWFILLGFAGIRLSEITLLRKYEGKFSAIIMVACIVLLIRGLFQPQ